MTQDCCDSAAGQKSASGSARSDEDAGSNPQECRNCYVFFLATASAGPLLPGGGRSRDAGVETKVPAEAKEAEATDFYVIITQIEKAISKWIYYYYVLGLLLLQLIKKASCFLL